MLYLSDIYPASLDESEYATVGCALHYYASKLYGESKELEEYCNSYGVEKEECKKYLQELQSACAI